jgi:hypothetical protein
MTDIMTDYVPVKVHITRDDTKAAPESKPINVVSKTYLAGTSAEMILPRTIKRTHAVISVLGVVPTQGNVILADNQADATAAATYSATLVGTIPGGALQPGQQIDVYHNEEVWLARLGTAGAAPIVSVVSEYC